MHWIAHLLGFDNGNNPVYLALSGVVGVAIASGAVWAWLKRSARHHRERIAQAAKHHREQMQQAADHHVALKSLHEKHNRQRMDQATAHHDALKRHLEWLTGTKEKSM